MAHHHVHFESLPSPLQITCSWKCIYMLGIYMPDPAPFLSISHSLGVNICPHLIDVPGFGFGRVMEMVSWELRSSNKRWNEAKKENCRRNSGEV